MRRIVPALFVSALIMTPTPALAEVDRSAAEQIALEAETSGQQVTVQLSLSQAMNLQSKLRSVSTDGATVRYLTIDGEEIRGVKRQVNKSDRTLTLTFPPGHVPDNPVVIEAVREEKSLAVVSLTDPSRPVAVAKDPTLSPVRAEAEPEGTSSLLWYVLGGLAALILGAGLAGQLGRIKS